MPASLPDVVSQPQHEYRVFVFLFGLKIRYAKKGFTNVVLCILDETSIRCKIKTVPVMCRNTLIYFVNVPFVFYGIKN